MIYLNTQHDVAIHVAVPIAIVVIIHTVNAHSQSMFTNMLTLFNELAYF